VSDFEKRAKFYLRTSGWTQYKKLWEKPDGSHLVYSIEEAYYKQQQADFEADGNIERSAELMDAS
jgi:hypothetical protein